MKRKLIVLGAALLISCPVAASDWEKVYTPVDTVGTIPSASPATIATSSGVIDKDVEMMWRRGFTPIGYSFFNTGNDKTSDALKLANKLHAHFVIVSTQLTSSNTASMPLTLPSSTTSQTNGTVSAFGSGGYSSGNYSGSTTTYGTQTTYIPITVNRFDKFGIFFQAAPKKGTGILPRELNSTEVARFETRKGFVVRFVRDESPAFTADILPGDVITQVNGQPADLVSWQAAVHTAGTILVHLFRNGSFRGLNVVIPTEWAY